MPSAPVNTMNDIADRSEESKVPIHSSNCQFDRPHCHSERSEESKVPYTLIQLKDAQHIAYNPYP